MGFFLKLFGLKKTLPGTSKILPVLEWANAKAFEHGSLIYDGAEKLLKIIADDIVCYFVLEQEGTEPIVINRSFMMEYDITPEKIAAIAEINLTKLFSSQNPQFNISHNKIDIKAIMYSIRLNNKNESAIFFSKTMLELIRDRLIKEDFFISIPTQNEINFYKGDVYAIHRLINDTTTSFRNAGELKLSPNIYLFRNASYITFQGGWQEIYDYVVPRNEIIPFEKDQEFFEVIKTIRSYGIHISEEGLRRFHERFNSYHSRLKPKYPLDIIIRNMGGDYMPILDVFVPHSDDIATIIYEDYLTSESKLTGILSEIKRITKNVFTCEIINETPFDKYEGPRDVTIHFSVNGKEFVLTHEYDDGHLSEKFVFDKLFPAIKGNIHKGHLVYRHEESTNFIYFENEENFARFMKDFNKDYTYYKEV